MAGTINDLLAKAKDITGAAGAKTDEIYHSSRLKLTCVQLKTDIKNHYEMLGAAVYEMFKGLDNADDISAMIDDIDRCYKKLEETQSRIERMKSLVSCPNCKAKNKMDSTYCSKCGIRLITTEEDFSDNENSLPPELAFSDDE